MKYVKFSVLQLKKLLKSKKKFEIEIEKKKFQYYNAKKMRGKKFSENLATELIRNQKILELKNMSWRKDYN